MSDIRERPVIFGEVLFDSFPGGESVPGGAPFNVAWHLAGFGLSPRLVSRVGDDAAGRDIRRLMALWGLDDSDLQTDSELMTGEVRVSFNDDEPSFDILHPRAWDRIDPEPVFEIVGRQDVPLAYVGSLGRRSKRSRTAQEHILNYLGGRTFLDVNLRPPWTPVENVRPVLSRVSWIKVNSGEARALGLKDDELPPFSGLTGMVITSGAAGARIVTEGEISTAEPEPVDDFADSVGAGDAFAAVVIMGLLKRWSPGVILRRAVQFSALQCRYRGATVVDRSLYERCLSEWRAEP